MDVILNRLGLEDIDDQYVLDEQRDVWYADVSSPCTTNSDMCPIALSHKNKWWWLFSFLLIGKGHLWKRKLRGQPNHGTKNTESTRCSRTSLPEAPSVLGIPELSGSSRPSIHSPSIHLEFLGHLEPYLL